MHGSRGRQLMLTLGHGFEDIAVRDFDRLTFKGSPSQVRRLQDEKLHHDGTSLGIMDIQQAAHEEITGGLFDSEDIKSFRHMSKWDTLFALVTNRFGLGALGLPSAIKVLGLVPGITISGAAIITWYSGLGLHQFFCRHIHVVNIVEIITVVGGCPWEIVVGILLQIQVIMTCASTAVTLSIAFNAISDHVMCTCPLVSIVAAALTVMVSLGISSLSNAPGGWKVHITVVGNPSFRDNFNGVLKVIYAFAGNHAYVSYIAEMKNHVRDFPFALRWSVIVLWIFYMILAVTIYCLAGEYTTSPAPGSAPRLAAKVAYGLVLPDILTAGLSNGHIGVKYIYVGIIRQLKATDEITANTIKPWAIWLTCVTVFWIISLVLSNAIPVFDLIVSISLATTYAWFTYGISGVLWFSWNKGSYFNGWKQVCLLIINALLICFAFFLSGAGLWSSITELLDIFASGIGVRGSFSCGDNSSL